MAKQIAAARRNEAFIGVKMTKAERADLEHAAHRRGVTISEMVRTAVVRAIQDMPASNLVAG